MTAATSRLGKQARMTELLDEMALVRADLEHHRQAEERTDLANYMRVVNWAVGEWRRLSEELGALVARA